MGGSNRRRVGRMGSSCPAVNLVKHDMKFYPPQPTHWAIPLRFLIPNSSSLISCFYSTFVLRLCVSITIHLNRKPEIQFNSQSCRPRSTNSRPLALYDLPRLPDIFPTIRSDTDLCYRWLFATQETSKVRTLFLLLLFFRPLM